MMIVVISDHEMGCWLSLKERRIRDSEGMAMVVVDAWLVVSICMVSSTSRVKDLSLSLSNSNIKVNDEDGSSWSRNGILVKFNEA